MAVRCRRIAAPRSPSIPRRPDTDPVPGTPPSRVTASAVDISPCSSFLDPSVEHFSPQDSPASNRPPAEPSLASVLRRRRGRRASDKSPTNLSSHPRKNAIAVGPIADSDESDYHIVSDCSREPGFSSPTSSWRKLAIKSRSGTRCGCLYCSTVPPLLDQSTFLKFRPRTISDPKNADWAKPQRITLANVFDVLGSELAVRRQRPAAPGLPKSPDRFLRSRANKREDRPRSVAGDTTSSECRLRWAASTAAITWCSESFSPVRLE